MPHNKSLPQVFIVDDRPENIEVLAEFLDSEYDVRFALSGPDALELIAQRLPDLILLDVMMPGMDGYQVIERLKADERMRRIPVIFVTAKSDAESETRALAAGAVDFVHKPINRDVIRARIRLHLELERREKALKQNLADLIQAQTQLRVLSRAIEQSPTSVVITGTDATIQYVNPQFTRESGYSPEEVIGKNPRILQSGMTTPSSFREMWERLKNGEAWSGELVNRRKSGEVFWEEAHIAPVTDDEGNLLNFVAVKLDITERRKTQERLAHMAHHDVLTGLPNRVLFSEHVTQALALARRHRTRLALMFIDLDRFKPINDCYGHAVGDEVLKEAAQRMAGSVRKSDTVARIGGDEFVVLLNDVSDEAGALKVGEEIRRKLNEAFVVDGKTLYISSSIGLAIYPENGSTDIELSRNADYAMYHAKECGRNNVQVYRGGMDSCPVR